MWRVLFDANVYISYLLRPQGSTSVNRIVNLGLAGELSTVITHELLAEIQTKTSTKPDLRHRIDPTAVALLVTALVAVSDLVVSIPSDTPTQLRDLKDAYLLQASKAGDVDLLVTGDRDLLALRDEVERPLIVTPAELLAILERSNLQ